MTDDSFTIKPYHWWLTLSIAIVLHVFLLINYKQDNNHTHENVSSHQSEIIIGLKKLKHPPIAKQLNVIDIIEAVPVPVNPAIKKPKPIVIKPVVAAPKIATTNKVQKQKKTPSKQSQINTTSRNAANDSVSIGNEIALYYAQLAQWLERYKKYPTIARRRNQQDNVTIQFVMNKQGKLLRYKLIKPSKHDSLNRATIKMLERASPMPVPPKELIGDKIELKYTIPVNFKLVK
jgi:TonB family protein